VTCARCSGCGGSCGARAPRRFEDPLQDAGGIVLTALGALIGLRALRF